MYLHKVGPEDAPNILFIHGAGVAGWMWKPQLTDLSRDHHCLVPDLPGHGQNPAGDPFSFEASVEGIAAIVRQHGGRTHVVGLSMGATIATALMATYPELVDHAMISAPAFGPMPAHLLLLVRLLAPLTTRDFVINQSAKTLGVSDEDMPDFRQNQKRLTGPMVHQINNAIHTFSIPQSLKAVDVPVLAMVGEKELKINYHAAAQVVATMPHAIGRVAPGGGHAWNGENPGLFNQTLRAWFNDEPLPQSLLPLPEQS